MMARNRWVSDRLFVDINSEERWWLCANNDILDAHNEWIIVTNNNGNRDWVTALIGMAVENFMNGVSESKFLMKEFRWYMRLAQAFWIK